MIEELQEVVDDDIVEKAADDANTQSVATFNISQAQSMTTNATVDQSVSESQEPVEKPDFEALATEKEAEIQEYAKKIEKVKAEADDYKQTYERDIHKKTAIEEEKKEL